MSWGPMVQLFYLRVLTDWVPADGGAFNESIQKKLPILRKIAILSSILAIGLLFQNCSGDGGDGNGGGSNSGVNGGGGNGNGSGTDSGGNGNSNPSLDSTPSPPIQCDEGFVGVPGNNDYNIQDFCVMKYEAKAVDEDGVQVPFGCLNEACSSDNQRLLVTDYKVLSVPANKPWVKINRAEAIQACENSSLKLLTNAHWQTIARNIENVKENWANNEIGNIGGLNPGHHNGTGALAASTDDVPCHGTGQEGTACGVDTWHVNRRTHKLSTGEVIWDIAGNVWEWVTYDDPIWETNDIAITKLTGDMKNWFGPSRDYSAEGISDLSDPPHGHLGELYGNYGGEDDAVSRGGSWDDAGVFATDLHNPPSVRYTSIGFRCFYSPQ